MKTEVNGITLNYELGGSGRLIAFAHSLGMSGAIFDRIRPKLEPHGRVLTWDARGHGNSQRPAPGWSIEDLAADLRALIEHLGEDQAVIAGLSMGGNTAVAYASAYPGKVDGLILADTTAWYGEGAAAAWEQRAQKAETVGLAPVIPFNLPRWFSDGYPDAHPQESQRISDILTTGDAASYSAACRALGSFDGRDGLKRIICPTLVMVGAEDPATPPAMAEYLHQNIRNSELHVLDGLRHMTPVEAPEQVGDLIGGFLEKL
jgi:3-oxoadipate enol-lactonase